MIPTPWWSRWWWMTLKRWLNHGTAVSPTHASATASCMNLSAPKTTATRWTRAASPGRSTRNNYIRSLDHQLRFRNAVSLRVIHAQGPQLVQDLRVLHEFGDRLLTHDVTDLVDGFAQRQMHEIGLQVLDEQAIDLDEIYRDVLQIGERGKPTAEIVQGETTAQLP